MTKEIKCPNCGQLVTSTDGVCPNCDNFSPNNEKIKKTVVIPEEVIEEPVSETIEKASSEKEVSKPIEIPEEKSEETSNKTSNEMTKFAPAAAIIEKQKAAETAKEDNDEKAVVEKAVVEKAVVEKAVVDEVVAEKTEPVATTVSDMDPRKGDRKKGSSGKKAATGLAALLLMLGGGYGYTKYQETNDAEQQAQLEKKAALTETHIDQLYLNEEKVFLSESFDSEKLSNVTKEISEIKDEEMKKELTKQLDVVTEKSEQLNEANGLFQQAIIKGDKLAEKPVLKTTVTEIPKAMPNPKDDFDKLYNKALSIGEQQLNSNADTKKAIEKLVDKNGKAIKNITRSDYDAAKKLVDKLADKELAAKYKKQLEVADKAIKESEQKADKEKAKAEQESKNQDAANSNVTVNDSNNSVAGSVDHGANSDNGSMVKDGIVIHGRTPGSTTEGDWSWAPGVQENFINTAIARGYVTAGGYELRAKEIINGEAYYELYATRRDTALSQEFSDNQLPIYMVTVNAKTGSFRGGAPNYSDAQ